MSEDLKDENKKEEQSKNDSTENKQVDVEKVVEERLAEIKSKLDSAYKARDDAQAKLQKKEEDERKAALEKLKQEGKELEALQAELEAEKTARTNAEKKAKELERDSQLRAALLGLNFKNQRASSIAFKEIVDDLVAGENGVWIHKSGKDLDSFVRAFKEDSSNSFLFATELNSGAGSSSSSKNENSKPKSLLNLSTSEILKKAREGTLRK